MKLIMITTLAGPALTADAGTPVDVDDKFGKALKEGKFARDPNPGELKGGMSDAAFMAAITGKTADDGLKQDGPTVADYVKAGYSAKNYPPAGYASKSTEAEIADAVAAEEAARIAKAKSPESVKAALEKLDPANDDDWTAAGKPAMGRIEALLDIKGITRTEVDAMFPDFKRPDQGGGSGGGGSGNGPRTNNR